jgi:hypothetical protein
VPIAAERDALYVHVPKTGGTSIERELNGDGLWDRLRAHADGARLVRALKAIYPINVVAWFAEKHLPAVVLRELVPREQWDRCFKFAFVRNPWDVVVSTYFYVTKVSDWFRAHEPDYAAVIERCDFREFVHYYPMIARDSCALILDERGEPLVDFVGRYESLEADFAQVCRRIGISAPLARHNRSEHAHYREYYDDETKRIVERHFARDIERFGYRY